MSYSEDLLSQDTRKALRLHLGEKASSELLSAIDKLANEVKQLQRTKVSVTPIVPFRTVEETVIISD